MRRADDLQRLIALRKLRIDRAVAALSERTAACDAARRRLDEATADAVANGERRSARETALFDRLSLRPLTPGEIGRARDALGALEAEAEALDHAEQDAVRLLEAEKRRRAEVAADRLRLERERDKLATLAEARAGAARLRAELTAELDQDEAGGPGHRGRSLGGSR